MQEQHPAAEQSRQTPTSFRIRIIRKLALVAAGIALIVMVTAVRMRISGYYDLALASVPVAIGGSLVGLAACWVLMARYSIGLRVGITAVATILLVMFIYSCRDVRHKMHCESITLTMQNMMTIGRGIQSYRNDHGGEYPYDPRGPLESLALLYPDYVDDANAFTSAGISRYWSRRRLGRRFPEGTALAGAPCHYDYIWPIPENAGSSLAIATTIPECYPENPGVVILFEDGHVSWEGRISPVGDQPAHTAD